MGLFLTHSELQELTGYKLPTKQVGWLINRGYFVETNARGIPRITYLQVEDMRRQQTPINLLPFNNTHLINKHINLGQKQQIASSNNQLTAITSEPNINNLIHKINQAIKHG